MAGLSHIRMRPAEKPKNTGHEPNAHWIAGGAARTRWRRRGELCPSSNSSSTGAADHEGTTMRKVLVAAFGATLFGLAYGVSPTSAAPVGPTQVAVPDSGIEQARTVRRKKVKRRGGVARSGTGTNVSQPERAVPQTGPGGGGG